MLKKILPAVPTIVALVAIAGLRTAGAQAMLDRDWVLDPRQSHLYMQTEKGEAIVEKHEFTSITGNVSRSGDAVLKIDLASLETGIDLRNVRMRFLLFETFKFASAEITAKLDKSKLAAIATAARTSYTLPARVNLHGITKDFDIPVTIARVSDTAVSVSTIKPVEVNAESFDFMKGLAKLSDAQNGVRIVPAASITFDLTFVSGSAATAAQAEARKREDEKTRTATQAISTEGCETRFIVITESNAIYFRTGSAELDDKSEPLLDTGADIAKRCPSVSFDVEGHTDSIGGHRYNQGLSERRAQAVVDYLTRKGVTAARIHAAGYGQTRPVASNASEDGRAKNRRIEFKVHKD
jgi:outer membrane protein OmpA-like peptidoglycan-associated protein